MIGGFLSVHPVICFFYFVSVFISCMVFKNPIYLGTLLVGAILLNVSLDGARKLRKSIKGYLIMAGVIAIMNPLFISKGNTILGYIGNKVITLEAIGYGIFFALSLLSLLIFFVAYNEVITPQKFLYLFSKIAPESSFIIMVTMRFIPLLKRRILEILGVQTAQGYLSETLSKKEQMKERMETLSTLVSWTLEESLENATSMRARGYGVFERTSAIAYRVDVRDKIIGVIMVSLVGLILYGTTIGAGHYDIYKQLGKYTIELKDWMQYIALVIFISIPITLQAKEWLEWQIIHYKM